MSSTTIKIVYRKDKTNAKGIAPIHLRFIKNRKVCYVSTGIALEAKYWDEDRNIIKKNCPNSARKNNYLKKLEIEYTEKIFRYQTEDLKISLKHLKKIITGAESISFFKVAEEIINRYNLENKIGTKYKSLSILNKVKKFCKKATLSFEEITVRFITEYETFLIQEFKNKRNTINKDLKFIKRVFNYAIQQELIDENLSPFKKMTLHSESTKRVVLSSEEISLLEHYIGNDIEAKCLKTCLFQYYSGGLRISDVLLLRKNNIENGRFNLTIKKTGKQLDHIIIPQAKLILQDFSDIRDEDGLIFNFIASGKKLDNSPEGIDDYISSTTALINKYLKKIAIRAGIKKNISTHVFRHSFATNALEMGLTTEQIQDILKHSNIRETQIYAKVQSKDIDKALLTFSSN